MSSTRELDPRARPDNPTQRTLRERVTTPDDGDVRVEADDLYVLVFDRVLFNLVKVNLVLILVLSQPGDHLILRHLSLLVGVGRQADPVR